MADITKKALAISLKKLLSKKELSKITIKDITDGVGIKRQTFYYHFGDVYDLIEWIYKNEIIEPIIKEKDTYATWQQGFLLIFKYVLKNKNFIRNTYNSISTEYVEMFIYKNTYELLKNVVEEEAQGINVKENDKEFVAKFYQYAFVGVIKEWIQSGMEEKPEDIIEKLNKIIYGNFKRALNSLKYDDWSTYFWQYDEFVKKYDITIKLTID